MANEIRNFSAAALVAFTGGLVPGTADIAPQHSVPSKSKPSTEYVVPTDSSLGKRYERLKLMDFNVPAICHMSRISQIPVVDFSSTGEVNFQEDVVAQGCGIVDNVAATNEPVDLSPLASSEFAFSEEYNTAGKQFVILFNQNGVPYVGEEFDSSPNNASPLENTVTQAKSAELSSPSSVVRRRSQPVSSEFTL